jgi:hypothetical protein
LWNICKESSWVVPAHERASAPAFIDLFASETGFQLAETIALFRTSLQQEVIERVAAEIERRILQPYETHHRSYWWYQGSNNWNGVCNGSIGSSFLLLVRDSKRLAAALALVLAGLEAFFDAAFEADGGSTEGVGYWQYGLMNVICFAEMLRQRTKGQIDLLSAHPKMPAIAAYPLNVMLSAGRFASFSDSHETHGFHPGIVVRLADRTEQAGIEQLLAGPGARTGLPMRLAMAVRTLLWWDGQRPEQATIDDAQLPHAGVARLVAATPAGKPVLVALKAGHNDENHNHNDVGSFVVHVDGETMLCDPGPGLYTAQYFSSARYDNVFASSYGHSVPVIGAGDRSGLQLDFYDI